MIVRSLAVNGTLLFETEEGEVWQIRHVYGPITVELRKLGHHDMRERGEQVPMPLKTFYREWH